MKRQLLPLHKSVRCPAGIVLGQALAYALVEVAKSELRQGCVTQAYIATTSCGLP